MAIAMDLLLMMGGVAVFMHSMKLMSSGLEQSAGAGVKRLFRKISKNRFMDYAVGIGTTAIVQSSSATSIMTVGLANAKIVDLKQGSGIILGAKVGTTLTAFIFAMSGISKGGLSISAIFAFVGFLGVILMMVSDKESVKKIALFLAGFGMLFVGLEVMEMAIGGKDSFLSVEISKLFAVEAMHNPVLLLLLGIVFTCVIQSSTAATGIFIALLQTGVIGTIDQSFFLVMGANIGTCSDGIVASFGTNADGKRIALFHVLTSTIGALFFTIVLVIFRESIVGLFSQISRPEWAFAIFNLSYNTIYTLVLLALISPLITLCKKLIKDKTVEEHKLKYIDKRLLATPSLAIDHTLREVIDMAQLTQENFARAFNGLINEDMSESKKIASDEYQIDFLTKELAGFIISVSSQNISHSAEKLMGRLHHVITDLERIGDHAVTLAKETSFMKQQELHFMDECKGELRELFASLTNLFEMSIATFKSQKADKLVDISHLHKKIAQEIATCKENHTTRLNAGGYSVEFSKTYYSVLLTFERVADHLVNVAFSVKSNTGSKSEAFSKMAKEKK